MNYRFSCTLCGDCCWGNQVVRLNKEDLILMAQYKGFSNTSELFTQGLVEPVKEEPGWRPRIRFRTKPAKFCPFLSNSLTEEGTLQGLCSLHPHHKPLVCHLSPLGRSLEPVSGNEDWVVTPPVEGCPGMGRGDLRSLETDREVFRARLDREREFFQFLQDQSPGCSTAAVAVEQLFSYPCDAEGPSESPERG